MYWAIRGKPQHLSRHLFVRGSHLGCCRHCWLPSSALLCGALPGADHLLCRFLTNLVALELFLRRVYRVDSSLQRNVHFYLEEAVLWNKNPSRTGHSLMCSLKQQACSTESGFECFIVQTPNLKAKLLGTSPHRWKMERKRKKKVHSNSFEAKLLGAGVHSQVDKEPSDLCFWIYNMDSATRSAV